MSNKASPKPKKNTPKKKPQISEVILERDEFMWEQLSRQPNTRPRPLRIYMNLEQMKQMEYKVGDFFKIHSPSASSFGYIWPIISVAKDCVQLDYHLLKNLNLSDSSTRVTLFKWDQDPIFCQELKLIPLDIQKIDESALLYLKEVSSTFKIDLVDLEYCIKGQLIDCPIDGISTWFRVEVDQSDKIYHIKRDTIVDIVNSISNNSFEIDFSVIGGLESEINEITTMIKRPLETPEIFTKYGLKPPRGLLLHGPPGTGKTLVARAIASQSNCHFIVVNGPEIVSKYYGETEQKLIQIFKQAKQFEPSIIFFDELDSICPKRDESGSELEKRVVGCLLTLMDGGEDPGRVIVIGATNRPDAIDPALRRPGRFDREFEIGIPSLKGRVDILRKLLSKTNNCLSDEEIQDIAALAHGYVGADLSAVCRAGGLQTLQRVRKELGDNDKLISESSLLVINKHDLLQGMKKVKPSVIRDVLIQVPKVYWSDIGGQDDIKERLKEAVEWPLKRPEIFERFHIRPPKGLLLYGPPGCSKTLMAKALATESGLNFLAVKGPEDEIDALAVRRSGGDASVADRVLAQILTEMDGIEPLVNVTIVAATNRPDILDSALLRPGRIDSILYVGPPNLESREIIFRNNIKNIPSELIDYANLAKLTEGFSGAETVSVIQQACLFAISSNSECLTNNHLVEAISRTTKRISPEMLQFYENFRNRSRLKSV